jgi:hypothetical protein
MRKGQWGWLLHLEDERREADARHAAAKPPRPAKNVIPMSARGAYYQSKGETRH